MNNCPSCGASQGDAHFERCYFVTYGEDAMRFAMARLLERLVAEDYVRPERAPELMNRSFNLERGNGFITNKQLEDQQSEEDLLS